MFRDKKTETKHGIRAGLVGILVNILLFAGKIAVGLISSSITIVADAINNLADASSSVVTVIGFKLSARPADEEHPFGHERIEQICALLIAIIVLAVGVLLGKSSIEKIITPEPITVSIATYIVLALGIVGKLGLMFFLRIYGKKIDSDSLIASSADARNDSISTTAVLISTIVIGTTGVNIDGYMGLAVSIFIVISAIIMFKEIMSPLLGEKADKEFKSHPAKYPTMREQNAWKKAQFVQLLKQYPKSAVITHLPNIFNLLPDLPSLLENNHVTSGERGTMAVLRQKGFLAAVDHYLGGKWYMLVLLLPLLALHGIVLLLALCQFVKYIRYWQWRWLLVFGVLVFYYVWAPGPVISPRYLLPALPMLIFMAVDFILYTFSNNNTKG